MIKNIYKLMLCSTLLLVTATLSSCKDYLDRSPEAEVSPTDAFISFNNFQGFVEELYSSVPDYTIYTWACDWILGDEILNKVGGIWVNDELDKGNSWVWDSWISWLSAADIKTDGDTGKGLWSNAWYAIRKANLGLENLENLTDATPEQRDIIKGQLLFFRGFYHFELMTYWGGMPYIDKAFSSADKLEYPRLNCHQTAERIAQDLREAADLLPADWDKTATGKLTLGKNQLRVSKITALGYLGKNYLYAGSPLLNYESTGNKQFDTEYCRKAAEVFAELLGYVDRQETQVKLIDWDNYSFLFYSHGKNGAIPGYPEAVFQCPVYNAWLKGCPWGPSSNYGDSKANPGAYSSPNARFVENYGTKNGLPIDDPDNLQYDKSDPWANRDPRFYHNIIYDGVQVVKGSMPDADEKYRYADLTTNGHSRVNDKSGRTGYGLRKLVPMDNNNYDQWNDNYMHLSYMRLADVYLMYAEAVLQGYGSATSTGPDYITPAAAINIIRKRCGAGNVGAKYVNDKEKFMGEIIRERAMELGFEEEFRYNDLRRWMIADQLKYREKTAIYFDRGADGKPINMREEVLVTRPFESKHWWLPLRIKDVSNYPSFGQNPGW